jgi:hypothetical protein
MALPEFEKTLDFLERSGIDQVRLLGGEPTLHPDFPGLVDRVLGRGLRLVVFSNGLMPESALRRLEDTPVDRAAVLLNVTDYAVRAQEERDRQTKAMRRLGPRVGLGLNIYAAVFQPGFLLELTREHGLSPCVRLGLAHPCVEGTNRYLHPRYYAAVGRRLAEFARQVKAAGVRLGLDCGFVPCMFPDGKLDALAESDGGFGPGCSPLPDVLPDGRVVSCYPLAAIHTETLDPEHDAAWLRSRFSARLAPLRCLGVFRECAKCNLRHSGQCAGGCLAAAMLRLRWAKKVSTADALWCDHYAGAETP